MSVLEMLVDKKEQLHAIMTSLRV